MSQPDGKFVGAGGLPTRITHPEPGPLTVAATVQAQATREIEALGGEMMALQAALQQMEGTLRDFRESQVQGTWTAPLTRTREVMARIAQAVGSLKQLEQAIGDANSTIETLRAERGQLQALCLIAEHLNASMSRPDLMAHVLDDLLMLLHSERGAILLANDKGDLHFEAARQANGTRLNSDEYPMHVGIAKQVLTTGQPKLSNNHHSGGQGRIHSIMCAPLRISGKTLGIVYVDRLADGGLFTPEHLDLLAAFCNEAAIAIENANLFAAQQLHLQEIAAMKTYTDSILSSIGSGVLAVDNHGRVTRANLALEEILDLREADVLDRPCDQVLAVIEDAELLTQLRVAIAQQNDGGTHLVHAPISGHHTRKDQPCTLSVGWSALTDADNHRLGTVIVIDDLTDLAQAQREAEVFRRYVHPEVVDYVVRQPNATKLGGQTREISVIFADISGYTAMSEEMPPEQLVELLNQYLTLMTEAVFAEQGTVTMFQGDAVMAIYNAPPEQPDHALRAVRTALRMRSAIESYKQRTGQRDVQFSVGVNTGIALVGNIGAQGRLQNYTAIGDVVNMAKRLEECADKNQILLGEGTMHYVASAVQVKPLGETRVKGKSRPQRIWELQRLMAG